MIALTLQNLRALGDDDLIEIRLAISAELVRRRMARNPSGAPSPEKAPGRWPWPNDDLGEDCGTDRLPIR
jgi:hypothetical protein